MRPTSYEMRPRVKWQCNPSHAFIGLTPIVDDSGAEVEWPLLAGSRQMYRTATAP